MQWQPDHHMMALWDLELLGVVLMQLPPSSSTTIPANCESRKITQVSRCAITEAQGSGRPCYVQLYETRRYLGLTFAVQKDLNGLRYRSFQNVSPSNKIMWRDKREEQSCWDKVTPPTSCAAIMGSVWPPECWGLSIYARTHCMSFIHEEKCWPPRRDTHIHYCQVRTLQHYDIRITRLFQTHPSLLPQPLRQNKGEDRWDQSSTEHRTTCTMRTFLFFITARWDILYTTNHTKSLCNSPSFWHF